MADVGRIFVGVAPDEVARSDLALALGPLQPLPGRLMPPENWHVTLRFIGSMDDVAYDRLLAGLDQADLGDRFTVRFHRLGAFPNPRRATVLWVGVDRGGDELGALAAGVESVVTDIGFEPEERPFHAHRTLARIRPQQNVSRVVDADITPTRWECDRVTVFRSNLGPSGARYEALESFVL